MFDGKFTLDDVRQRSREARNRSGEEGFRLEGQSSMSQISRDPTELVGQTIGKHHCYPDGFALFLGTMFAPIVGSRRRRARFHAQERRCRPGVHARSSVC